MHMIMRNPAQMLFLFTMVILAYLVLPPFFFHAQISLVTDRGLQAGSFTIQHFLNIVDSLFALKTSRLSLIYAVTSFSPLPWFTAGRSRGSPSAATRHFANSPITHPPCRSRFQASSKLSAGSWFSALLPYCSTLLELNHWDSAFF